MPEDDVSVEIKLRRIGHLWTLAYYSKLSPVLLTVEVLSGSGRREMVELMPLEYLEMVNLIQSISDRLMTFLPTSKD